LWNDGQSKSQRKEIKSDRRTEGRCFAGLPHGKESKERFKIILLISTTLRNGRDEPIPRGWALKRLQPPLMRNVPFMNLPAE
jgi:hypothetical protein